MPWSRDFSEKLRSTPRKWLVTGAAGFIGSHLVENLLSLGQRVVGIDNFLTGRQENIDAILSRVDSDATARFQFHRGDVTQREDCLRALEGVDVVLHHAALGSVPWSISDPLATVHHNVTGFVQLAHSAQEVGIKRIVYASSSAVYGDDLVLPKIENSVGRVLSPYAASKMSNEDFAESFSASYGLEFVGLRYFNVFGPRQAMDGPYASVIPRWIHQMIRGEEIEVFGDGKTTRDFCFVDNVVFMNLLAGVTDQSQALNQVYNVGCGEETHLNDLFTEVKKCVEQTSGNKVESLPKYVDFRQGDIRSSLADISKARNLLNYQPIVDLHEGLLQTVSSYSS